MRIRPAAPGEGERLREIAIAAKAHWGYDRALLEPWAADGDYESKRAIVAEADGRVVAWAAVIPRGDTCWLDDLWVEPEWMRKGVGSALFHAAVEQAKELGCTRVEWEAERHAVGFYEKLGGRFVRDGEPSAWGEPSPIFALELV